MGQLVFVVDVDPEHCQKVKDSLEQAGYTVHVPSMDAVVSDINASQPAVILMSDRLSDGNGFAICEQLRMDALRTALVLMLEDTADQDRTLVLKAGADDYIAKPFSSEELVAKIGAVLGRFPSSSAMPSGTADIVIDGWGMKVSVRGADVPVTTLEFRLIEYLARHRQQVFTRDLLLDAVWGQTQFVTPRSVDACIRRIRGKIELNRAKPILLKTVRGVGYRLDATTSWNSNVNEDCTCIACTRGTRTLEVSHLTRKPGGEPVGKRSAIPDRLDGRCDGARLT